jgi:hypothetical protein
MRALIWTVNIAALCALIATLVARRAWRSWPWFGLFLLMSLLRDLILYALQGNLRYFWTYVAFEPVVLTAATATVMEVWRARTRSLVNVGRAGHYFLIGALLIATLTMFAVAVAGGGPWDTQLRALLAVRQWVVSILAVFALTGHLILNLFGNISSPAVQRHHWLVSLYFILQASAFAVGMLVEQDSLRGMNIAMLAAGAVLYACWALVLEPAPSLPPPKPGPRAEEVERQVGEFLATLQAAAGSARNRPPYK